MTKTKEKTDRIVLFVNDDEQETRYVTAKFEDDELIVSFSNFNHTVDKYVVDYRYKFNKKETKKFIKLLSNGEPTFLQKLQEKFNSSSACADLIKYAEINDIEYEYISGHEGGEYYRYELGDIFLDDDLLYDKNKNIIIPSFYKHPINGVMKIYLRNGNLYMSISYKNNKKNGFTKCYSKKTKKIVWEQNYTNDKLDGIIKNYYSDGSIEKEETFVNGVKQGWENSYNENESYLEEAIMYAQNVKNGQAFKYYPNGQVKHEAFFENDLQEGTTKEYYESGQLKYVGEFKKDEAVGWGISYYENGNVKWKSPHGKTKGLETKYYENGNIEFEIETIGENRNGKYTNYYEDGTISETGCYKNDEYDGCRKKYYKNGNLEHEYNYKNGKKHGICKDFHYNGKIREIFPYKNGKLNGKVQRFYSNGQLNYEYNYKNGLRNGFSISYDQKAGEIQLKQYFKDGMLRDFYGNEGIVGVQGLAEINTEEGKKTVKTREMTKEEKELWKPENLLDPVVTNKARTSCIVFLYNIVMKRYPIIVEKLNGDDAKEYLNKSAKRDNFIIEDDEFLDKLSKLELHDSIPSELQEKTVDIISLIMELKNKYDIKKGIIRGNEVIVPNEGIVEIKKKNNKNNSQIKNNKINSDFNLDLVNCSRDLKFLTDKIITNKNLNFSICIYGDPGTGKSAYARYLADKLGIDVVCRTAADILDQYVGNSEKQIAEAFEEAEEKKAMLIIDEVDSFLRSRGLAQRNWEVTIVNQMLTCMEKFNYPFICTTNFIDSLDQASLRRFTFKFKFGFLKPDQIEDAFNYVFNTKPSEEILKMKGLTVSDFVNIKKECDILGITDINEIAKMLDETVSLKESEDLSTNIGFN